MTCAIIEDDRNTVSMLSAIIKENYDFVTVSGTASSVLKGLALIHAQKPDFLLLDINLSDGNSFDILKNMEGINPKIIFITGETKSANEVLQFEGVIGYLIKPFAPLEVVKIINRAIKQINLENQHAVITSSKEQSTNSFYNNDNELDKTIILSNKLNDNNELVIIKLKDIVFIESDNNRSYVHTIDNEKIKENKTLKQFEKELCSTYFFRTNQSFLLNLNYVKRFENDTYEAILSNDKYIPVSQNKKQAFILALKNLT